MRGRVLVRALASALVLLSSVWAVLALHFALPGPVWVGAVVGGLWVIVSVILVVGLWRGRAAPSMVAYGLAWVLLLGWWSSLRPADDRVWADDVAHPMHARVQGHELVVDQVRNFDWRSETDYTVRWETRRYDLRQLRTVDMAVSYWMGPAIAHTLVSFGFDDGRGGQDQLVFSIEIRKERNESFSAVAGFFKRFELSLVAADERDILRVRTNVRGEDVYLYRVQMPTQAMRSLLLAYVQEADALARAPRFYHTLWANCTTIVYQMAQRIVGGLPLDWRLLASGYLPEYLASVSALVPGYSVAELRAAGRITARAQSADRDPQFSQRIRQGVPGMEGTP